MKGFRGHLAVTVTGGLEEIVTPWAGASTLVEAYRSYGVGDAADRALPRKKTAKGLSQGQMTESFVLLSALGGEYIEDMERLRQDKGLEAMVRYKIPAPETARQWLDKFHDEGLMSGQPEQGAFIPVESAPLAGLREPDNCFYPANSIECHGKLPKISSNINSLKESTKESTVYGSMRPLLGKVEKWTAIKFKSGL